MSVKYAGLTCVDPRDLLATCQDQRIPAEPWIGRANLYRCPAGRGPGVGAVLMTAQDLLGIDQTTDHTLTFEDDAAKIELKKLTITRATCVVPGTPDKTVGTQTIQGEPWRVYLVELADRRYHLDRIPIAKAYNVRDDAGTGWLAGTVASVGPPVVPWTWNGIGENLWNAVGGLGTWVTLPWTPHGTPENLDYYGTVGKHWSAWEALNDFLERLAAVLDYDPMADTFTVRQIGVEPTVETEALTRLNGDPLTWDGDPKEGVRPNRPEKIRVRFLRQPAPTGGTDPWYSVDVTITAKPGVVTGSMVILEDDSAAQGATGTPGNSATLAARATDRADDWVRKFEKRDRRLLRVYRDLATEPGIVVGATATGAGWEDRGNGLRSELESGPDGLLEAWKRAPVKGGSGGDSTFLVLLTDRDFGSTFYKYSAVEVENPTPTVYAIKSGGRTFSPGTTPLYQQRNMIHPVVGLDGGGAPNFIKKGSVVRVWLGPDGVYFFKALPPVVPLRRSGDEGTVGETAFIRENRNNDPGAPTWVDGDEVEVVPVE